MSGRTPSPRDEEPTEEEVCADCLGGLLFSEEECSTCEPRRKLRKANPEIARRVASDEWKSLLEEARKHLGFHGADHLAGYWMALGLVVSDPIFVDAGSGSLFKFDHDDPIIGTSQTILIDTGRAAHALASWLGTSSVFPVTVSLLTGDPLHAEQLTPSHRSTAPDRYVNAFLRAAGMLDGPAVSVRDGINDYMRDYRLAAKDFGLDWDEFRAHWNRQKPGMKFDSKEALRAMFKRANPRPRRRPRR